MKIDENWNDAEVVNIEFIGMCGKRFTRMLVLPSGKSKEEIVHLLERDFPPVKKYTYIEVFQECFYYTGNYFGTTCNSCEF